MSKQLLKEPSDGLQEQKKLSACTEAHICKNRNKQPVCWYYTPETLTGHDRVTNPACQLQVCFTKTDSKTDFSVCLCLCLCAAANTYSQNWDHSSGKSSPVRDTSSSVEFDRSMKHLPIISSTSIPTSAMLHPQHSNIHKNPFWTLQELKKKDVVWLRWGGQTEEPNSWKSK